MFSAVNLLILFVVWMVATIAVALLGRHLYQTRQLLGEMDVVGFLCVLILYATFTSWYFNLGA